MSILAGMFETVFISYCSVCLLGEGFFVLLQHRKIAKAKKQAFFKLNNCQKTFSIACAEQQCFIILNGNNFACKHKKITEILSFFESAQILVSLFSVNFFLFFVYFAVEAGIVLNLFLNFGQKWASCFRKSFL